MMMRATFALTLGLSESTLSRFKARFPTGTKWTQNKKNGF